MNLLHKILSHQFLIVVLLKCIQFTPHTCAKKRYM